MTDSGAKKPLLGLTVEELKPLLPDAPAYTAKQVRAFCFEGKKIDEMTSLPKKLRAELEENFVANPVSVMRVYRSKDGSSKYLFSLTDGNLIEGVYMPHSYGNTLCVSTQIGCRMHCAFCASGADGLVRDLDFSEILGQVVAVNAAEGGAPSQISCSWAAVSLSTITATSCAFWTKCPRPTG